MSQFFKVNSLLLLRCRTLDAIFLSKLKKARMKIINKNLKITKKCSKKRKSFVYRKKAKKK